ncbi:MAG: uL13 family ribosomal protein [Candidatus Berkelbacteria bacterium]|nr:uL13 family ribosomal protein [Candidatus Berkelbacteria bacterium]
MKTVRLDVKNIPIGRAASEAAKILLGKDSVSFSANKVVEVELVIENIEDIALDTKKISKKAYFKHSGYLGNLKTIKAQDLIDKDPKSYFKAVVAGMLPNNRLKKPRLKKIKFKGS